MSGPSPQAVLSLLRSQLSIHPKSVKSSFAGQTVLVTGGNAGLGKAAARILVELDAKTVIIAVRTVAKGQQAKKDIETATKRQDIIQVWPLDLADNASVLTFGERVQALERLDAVILNAGMWPTSHVIEQDHELTLLVNVISTVLTAYLVLPKLRQTADQHDTTTRLTFVGSNLHKFATLSARKSEAKNLIVALDQQVFKSGSDLDSRYNDTKLLLQMYGQRLARQHEGKYGHGVNITVVNPGYCYSGLKKPTDFGTRIFEKTLARSTDEGAYCLVDAVALDKALGRHGQYLDDQMVKKAAPWIDTVEGQQTSDRLWNDINALLEVLAPGVTA